MRRILSSFSLILTITLFVNAEQPAGPVLADIWMHGVQARVRALEYELNGPERSGDHINERWQTVNRAHRWRLFFDASGVQVHDRIVHSSPSLLKLESFSWGRSGDLRMLAPATVSVVRNTVEMARPGIDEWFVNSPEGLEHGYSIPSRLFGDGELKIELKVTGAAVDKHGDGVRFVTDFGRILFYDRLYAFDHDGESLPAWFVIAEAGRVHIVVDDRDAVYPIRIDPFLTAGVDAQIEADQERAYLGTSVSGAGDVNGDGFADLIVGADLYDSGDIDEGAVFIFHGSADGIRGAGPVDADARIESNQSGAKLGFSVASAGDVNNDGFDDIIIGAPAFYSSMPGEGITVLFLGGINGISGTSPADADAVITGGMSGVNFGSGVASGGDVNGDGFADVIVGAEYYSNGEADEGLAFIFHGSAAGIDATSASMADGRIESDQAGARLGHRLASAGDVNGDGFDDIVFGVQLYDHPETDEGAVFVFHGSTNGIRGTSPADADTVLDSNQAWSRFGSSVAAAGDVNGDGIADLLIGASLFDRGENDEGAAFVFHGSSGGIASNDAGGSDALLQSDQAGAWFGTSVSSAGDVNGDGFSDVIIGASQFDAGEDDEGAAFVFFGSSGGIGDHPAASADDQLEVNQAGARMGHSVATAGDVNGDGFSDVVVGALFYDNGQNSEGAAFVYHGSGDGLSRIGPDDADTRIAGGQNGGTFGLRVATAGDVNGDGFDDIIVGAPYFDRGEADEGVAFVFHGSALGILNVVPESADGIIESNEDGAQLGLSVASAGDVNHDGFDDIIVGIPLFDGTGSDNGAILIALGSASGINEVDPTTAASVILSDQEGSQLGNAVGGAGDVNGDGFDDVIAGALRYDDPEVDEGVVFVLHGSAGGIGSNGLDDVDAVIGSNQAYARFGKSVGGAGDVNGDGFSDVIIGAFLYDNSLSDEGLVIVVHGSPGGIIAGSPDEAATRIAYDEAGAWFGQSVAGVGDVNLDGFDDIIVGAPRAGIDQVEEGRAFVFLGSSDGVSSDLESANAVIESDQPGANLGWSVGVGGDLNGDGFADITVGAPFYDRGQTDEGIGAIYLGSSHGITGGSVLNADVIIESNQADAWLGFSLETAGDVNGDGFSDLLVGAHQYDSGNADEGLAMVFFGGGVLPGCGVQVLAPNGGERWRAGRGESVGWAMNGADCSDEVVISLFDDGDHILSTSVPNSGSLVWQIPSTTTPGNRFRIRIRDGANSFYFDQSDGNFSIEQAFGCSIEVLGPNGGETYGYGESVEIRWREIEAGCDGLVRITLTLAGNEVEVISNGTTSDGSFEWIVPLDLTPGSQYRIRVASIEDPSALDESDGTFTIVGGLGASFEFSPRSPVVDQPVQFSDSSVGSPDGWSWDFDDGSTSTLQHPRHFFAQAKVYDVCLTVALGGARSVTCHEVGVSKLSANFVYTPPQPVVGEETHFADWSIGEPLAWTWDFGDGHFDSAQNPIHIFTSAGVFEVCQTVIRDVAATQLCDSVTVVEQAPCGDQLCQLGETATGCPEDCAPALCGDLFCHFTENHFKCPQDCAEPVCGNLECELGETTWGCPSDCESDDDESDRPGKACMDCSLPAVVGGIAGVGGSFWVTEAMLFNSGDEPTRVTVHYTPDDPFPSKSFGPFIVNPGEAGYFTNFVNQFFGETANGSIRIKADNPIMVVSRTFNDREDGTFGQLIAASETDQVFGSDDTGYILGVEENEDFRTNLVVQEVTGKKTNFVLKVYDSSGWVGERSLSVEANRKDLWSFGSGPSGAYLGFGELEGAHATIEVVSGGRLVAIASIVDNNTGDPRTVAAVDRRQVRAPLAKNGSSAEAHYLVAAIAHAPGYEGSLWRSGADIQNPFSTAQEVRLEYFPDGTNDRRVSSVWIESDEQRSWRDIYDLFPGAGDGKGSLHIYAPIGVIVNTTTYNVGPDGTFGQFIPGLSGGDLFGEGESGMLLGLQYDPLMRTNIGFAEHDGVDTRIRVTIYDVAGMGWRALGSQEYTIKGSKLSQPPVFRDIVGDDVVITAAVASVKVLNGGHIYVYASKIDNKTGDPTFIPAQRSR